MKEQLESKGKELSSLLLHLNASRSLLNNDLIALDELLHGFHDTKDIYMAFLLDEKGKVKASTDKSYFNRTLNDAMSLKLLAMARNIHDDLVLIEHLNMIDSVHKIKVGNTTIGYARIILNSANLSNELEIITNQGLFYIFLAIIIGALFAWFSIRRTTENLNKISEVATSIAEQNFDVKLPLLKGNDSCQQSRAFAVMISSIKSYIAELVERENKTKMASKS